MSRRTAEIHGCRLRPGIMAVNSYAGLSIPIHLQVSRQPGLFTRLQSFGELLPRSFTCFHASPSLDFLRTRAFLLSIDQKNSSNSTTNPNLRTPTTRQVLSSFFHSHLEIYFLRHLPVSTDTCLSISFPSHLCLPSFDQSQNSSSSSNNIIINLSESSNTNDY